MPGENGPAKHTNPAITILGTEEGDVVLRIDIRLSPHSAVKLGRVFVQAAQAMVKRKPSRERLTARQSSWTRSTIFWAGTIPNP